MARSQIGAVKHVPFEPNAGGGSQCNSGEQEATLIERAQQKDGEAFASLVQPHMYKVYWAALRITGNREDAEDAAQQSLWKAYVHLDQFHNKSRFSTWLLRIVINEALGKLRKRRSESSHVYERSADEAGSIKPEIFEAGEEVRPEVLYVKTERRRLVRQAIGELGGTSRAVVWLLGLEERRVKETAEILNLSESAVKARFLRARHKLRECLAGQV